MKREDAPRFKVGEFAFVNTRNMKSNRPMKKGDDKFTGPYKILKVYDRSCLLELPPQVRIFPVFHNSLLRPQHPSAGLPGQDTINEAESRHLRGRVLEREDGTEEAVERWEFETLLDCHNEDPKELQYLIKWKDHAATWQPASDLKGQEEVVRKFHENYPNKPKPHLIETESPVHLNFLPPHLPSETYGCMGRGYCHGTNLGVS